jgi:hypothetical protein
MRKLGICLAAASALVATAASAQWKLEPESVFGIQLGAPLSDAVPRCGPIYPAVESAKLCVRHYPKLPNMAGLENLPLSGIKHSAGLFFDEGAVMALRVEVAHQSYETLKAMLVERYGPPTTSETKVLTSRVGVAYQSESLNWLGKTNTITLTEREGKVDASVVSFGNVERRASAEARRKAAIAEGAAKF